MALWKWTKKKEIEKERLACWKLELGGEEGECGMLKVDEGGGN